MRKGQPAALDVRAIFTAAHDAIDAKEHMDRWAEIVEAAFVPGDWHDKPLKWEVKGPAAEVQNFSTKANAIMYAKIRRHSARLRRTPVGAEPQSGPTGESMRSWRYCDVTEIKTWRKRPRGS